MSTLRNGEASAALGADKVPQRNAPSSTENYEARAIAATNAVRRQHGLRTLIPNQRLHAAALKHSKDMFGQNLVTHGGSSFSNRSNNRRGDKEGVEFSVIAENVAGPNLAAGGINHLNHTPERTISRFMASPAHRVNILNREVRFIGMGYYKGFWTQIFVLPKRGAVFSRP